MSEKKLLAADVGGTKTNLAIFSLEQGLRTPLVEGSLASADYASLELLINDFLSNRKISTIYAASIGVAGPVINKKAKLTNLQWVIDAQRMQQSLSCASLFLMNDLVATAWAVPHLRPDDLFTIQQGEEEQGGAKGIVAPGTGLGEAYLVWDGQRYLANASEGGHVDFAPVNQLQLELLAYLRKSFEHVSLERVCSGMGLPNIYNFLKSTTDAREPADLRTDIAMHKDPVPLIMQRALDKANPCELCKKTLDVFVAVLAASAGNLALKLMATGGIYLGGGIPPRLVKEIDSEYFRTAFCNKGRVSDLMQRIPVHVITNPKAALMGAAAYGLQYMLVGEK